MEFSTPFACELLGKSRQSYYRNQWSILNQQNRATKTISLVPNIKIIMPSIGTLKLYYTEVLHIVMCS